MLLLVLREFGCVEATQPIHNGRWLLGAGGIVDVNQRLSGHLGAERGEVQVNPLGIQLAFDALPRRDGIGHGCFTCMDARMVDARMGIAWRALSLTN
jgi:hypothetical protein